MSLQSLTRLINRPRYDDLFWIVCLLVVAIVVVMPMVFWGIPDNYDLLQHLRFANTFYEALHSGSITPSWGASDNFGYGSAGVRLYPPLVYVILSVIQTFTQSWYDTIWISIFFWMFIGCVGVYYLAKEWLSLPQAASAAILYVFAPYHLAQVYQSFLLGEFTAAAILPFCFLFAYKIVNEGKWLHTLLFGMSFAFLILSHIPSTLIGSLALGFFVIFILKTKTLFRSVVRFSVAFSIGLAASSYYWIRLITEADWIKHSSKQFYGAGYYNYATYLFPLYFNGSTKYVERLLWFYDIETIVTLLLFIPLIVALALRVNRGKDRSLFAFAATGLFAFFMLSLGSKFLWDKIALLQKLQFPWRWLSIVSLTGVMVFCISGFPLVEKCKGRSRLLLYAFVSILLVIFLFDATQAILPSAPVAREEFSKRLEMLQTETGCECWWPIWVKNENLVQGEKVSAADRAIKINKGSGTSWSFTVDAGQSSSAGVKTFYYPYWQARVNGDTVAIGTDDDGTILIPLPAEVSTVDLSFVEPAHIAVTKIISLLTWLILSGSILALLFRRKDISSELI